MAGCWTHRTAHGSASIAVNRCSHTSHAANVAHQLHRQLCSGACGMHRALGADRRRHHWGAPYGSNNLQHSQRRLAVAAGEVAPEWTLDQIAGLGFGFFLLLTAWIAFQVDIFVARAQRRDLGLCEHCGGVNDPATCAEQRCPLPRGGSSGSDSK